MNDTDEQAKRPEPRPELPKLQPLDSLDLGLAPGALDGVVCDIDDPNCEVPGEPPSSVGRARGAEER